MAAMFAKSMIDEVRARSDIADIIGRYCRLQRAGSSYRTLCPFHREKTPSFHVNPARQAFHCFGCGKGGDVFRFIMEYENIDFPAAIRMLAEWAGVPVVEDARHEAVPAGPRKDVLYRLHAELAQWYHQHLEQAPAARVAREYLVSRDLPPQTSTDFLIGHAPDAWDETIKWGVANHFSEDQLVAAGVVIRRERDGRCYDRFRGRLMFPIRDEQGRVIAFSGRALRVDDETAKYINSPETVLFQKNRVLFGLDRARRPIVDAREALICEGQIDVIRCHVAGFQTAVAAQGTAFTEEHAVKLARFADGVVLVFDADHAGHEAAVKTAMICLKNGLSVRVVALPPGDDPDSLIRRQGAEAFGALLARAGDVLDFRLDALLKRENAATEIGMRTVTRGIADLVGAARDPVQRDRMVQQAARRLIIDPGVLHRAFRPNRPEPAVADRSGTAPSQIAPTSRPPEEWALIATLAAAPEAAGLVRDYLPPRRLNDPGCRAVLELMLAAAQAQETDLLAHCAVHAPDNPALQSLVAAALMAPSRISGQEFSCDEAIKDLILKIWRNRLSERLRGLLREDRPNGEGRVRNECAHLRADIKQLDKWETGAAIIEMLRSEE